MKKIITSLAVLSMVSMMALPLSARAQTTAELQAQINSLLGVLAQLQARLSLPVSAVPLSSYVFTSNLTVGSTGPDVVRLQTFLVSRGFLVMPPGVAFGYFGPLTRAALAGYQASSGISPAVGFFGPITRTNLNAILANAGGNGTTGGTTGGSPAPIGITTPGVEGIISVTNSTAGLVSTVYENSTQIPILGMKINARQSDMDVQRIKIDLGSSSVLYNRVLSRLYVTDGTNILASLDLNSSNVVKEGSEYFVTITGFNFIVPNNTNRTIVIKADALSSIDSTYDNTSFTIRLADGGLRSIDGAGIEHFDPQAGSSIAKSFIVQRSLSESATLNISLDQNSPISQDIVASSGANNNEADQVPVLVFDARANRDNITITDLQANIAKSGTGTANVTTAYLYDGSTELDNAPITNGVAVFHDLSYVIPQDSAKTLTVKIDVLNANSNPSNFTASVPVSGITAENSIGDTLASNSVTGSAVGYQLFVLNIGPEITLLSKSVVTNGTPQNNGINNANTSSMTASFVVRVRARGSDITFGLPNSASPMFDANSFTFYRNDAIDSSVGALQESVSYGPPSGVVTSGNSFTISQDNQADVTVTVQILGRRADNSVIPSGLYSIGINNLNWSANGVSQQTNFMAGNSDWKTNDLSFP